MQFSPFDFPLVLPDDALRKVDVVVASVHSAMNQNEERMTHRIIGAMENLHVDIITHPTYSLLGTRGPIVIDMETVFQTTSRAGTALEMDAILQHLDMKDIHAYCAREMGVKMVLSTDAHSSSQFNLMRFAIGVTQGVWCEARDLVDAVSRQGYGVAPEA